MGLQRPFFSSNLHHICRLRFTKRVLSCSRRAPFFDSLSPPRAVFFCVGQELAENRPITGVKRGAAVKKVVFTILIVSLAIGLPFMVLDFLYKGAKEFRVPEELEKLVVDLGTGERDGELLLERYLPVPSTVELFFQSNTEGPKHLRLKSEGEML